MNKKGFTLIELLAVVTLIALISIIAIPKISNILLNKKNEISEANQKLLSAATDTYIENHPLIYEYNYEANGSTYCIPVQILIDNGVLEKPFKNINGQEIDYSSKVKATYQAEYNSFSYELVASNECQELVQYVSKPQLAENMIPVIYDNDQNTWVKADKNSKWYNYLEKRWANAVVVKELKETENSKSRDEYINAPAGTPILESDILAQFVWIPRFRYQLFESETNQQINIVFEDVSTQKSLGTQTNQWLTHPAFTYNNQELSGIWVAKYEASNSNNNIIIKNQTPWTNIDYVEANKKTIQMTDENNIYGLKKVNTHMTRNSEWGAVAYLTNSIYGNQNNNSSTGNQTGIYNLSVNKEFVIQDNQDENSLGYALNETKTWTTDNSYLTNDNLYLTRGNNSIFNYNDSKVIDENTTFRITLTNTETQNQNYQKKYIVTFDPDGGTLSETTKEVSYHEPYGNLPTPTREGYTFLGWNGKNMLNTKDMSPELKLGLTTKTENGIWYITGTNTYHDASYGIKAMYGVPELEQGKIYTVSTSKILNNKLYVQMNYKNQSGTNKSIFYLGPASGGKKTFTVPDDYNYTGGTGDYIFIGALKETTEVNEIFTIQLEEGDTATEHEPYYITPSTTVVQQKNHTLKAIWQANS